MNQPSNNINRRNALKMLSAGSVAGMFGLFQTPQDRADKKSTPQWMAGLPPLKITDVKVIATAPEGSISHNGSYCHG